MTILNYSVQVLGRKLKKILKVKILTIRRSCYLKKRMGGYVSVVRTMKMVMSGRLLGMRCGFGRVS